MMMSFLGANKKTKKRREDIYIGGGVVWYVERQGMAIRSFHFKHVP
jgi:hypothetical protein